MGIFCLAQCTLQRNPGGLFYVLFPVL